MLTVATVGGFFGPVLVGWLYDLSASYRLAFLLLALGPLAAIPSSLRLGRPRARASLRETIASAV